MVQVDTNGSVGGEHWVTLARLDGVHTGNPANVIFDGSQPGGANLTVRDGFGAAVSGNFNGDTKADILLHNDNGQIQTQSGGCAG
jgi:hypothetical protein